jgi:hypothetical protein
LLADATGKIRQFPSWGSAVLATGMRAAAAVGQPLTHRKAKVFGISSHPDWDARVKRDADDLVLSGVMFLAPAPDSGFYWIRDLTTYLADDVTFFQDSASTALDEISYDVRSTVNRVFTGSMAVPFPALPPSGMVTVASVGAIKQTVNGILAKWRFRNVIVDQQDKDTGARIPGFDPTKTTVTISANVARIRYEIAVVNGIDFEPIEAFVQIPSA